MAGFTLTIIWAHICQFFYMLVGDILFTDLSVQRNCHVQSLIFVPSIQDSQMIWLKTIWQKVVDTCRTRSPKLCIVVTMGCRWWVERFVWWGGHHHKPSTTFQLEKLWLQIVHCSDGTLSQCNAMQCNEVGLLWHRCIRVQAEPVVTLSILQRPVFVAQPFLSSSSLFWLSSSNSIQIIIITIIIRNKKHL